MLDEESEEWKEIFTCTSTYMLEILLTACYKQKVTLWEKQTDPHGGLIFFHTRCLA